MCFLAFAISMVGGMKSTKWKTFVNSSEYGEFTKIKYKSGKDIRYHNLARTIVRDYIKPFFTTPWKLYDQNNTEWKSEQEAINDEMINKNEPGIKMSIEVKTKKNTFHSMALCLNKNVELATFPDLSYYSQSENIRLSVKMFHQNIQTIPSTLPDCLWDLSLSNTNVKTIPPNLTAKRLQCLYLAHTPIKVIPSTLPDRLQFLSLSNTNVKTIPPNLTAKGLQRLFLEHTPIEVMPSTLPDCLWHLSLKNTNVKTIPPNLTAKGLQYLYLDHTPINVIPSTFPDSLRVLSLKNTNVKTIPPNLTAKGLKVYLE